MISPEEVCRLHATALKATDAEVPRMPPRQFQRLDDALKRAALWSEESGTIERVALTALSIVRTEAFSAGNRRAALLVAATLLDRTGEPHTDDWLQVARALSQPEGHLGRALDAVTRALHPAGAERAPLTP